MPKWASVVGLVVVVVLGCILGIYAIVGSIRGLRKNRQMELDFQLLRARRRR